MLPPHPEHESMRRRLADGVLLASLRADAPPGVRVRTDAELDQSLADALRHHDPAEDLYVFGYGSLMWNPAIDAVHMSVARVQGWHRRFCLRMIFGRGTVAEPGAMLALDRGGACHGLLFRIEAAKVLPEARLLWRREMLAGSYEARWIRACTDAAPVRALTFVASRHHERYIGAQPIEHVVRLIRTGQGPLGTSRAYFESMLQTLEGLRIRDLGMERLRRAILLADRDAP
ncbi:gamma-glutamylcyclotransferase [Variovorax sp. WS11]|uniref:gamma-glutamylcyclotransferase n=2 Tax=Variovorax sp. WS11 TaxID=1105204 RepID=UPI002159735D|nr:gamma-glutamylcyclotransferase [Variovorax sp. WS11]